MCAVATGKSKRKSHYCTSFFTRTTKGFSVAGNAT